MDFRDCETILGLLFNDWERKDGSGQDEMCLVVIM